MITLFIDTSGADVSIAIVKEEQILSKITKTIPNQHSIYTVDFIDKCLKKANLKSTDIKKIMVVTGPGSFTGVRIGVTIAKVYAYLQNIPIIPISSLKMRALSIKHDYCMSLIDAHHQNYYLGLYDKENNEVISEGFYPKEKLLEFIEKYHPSIISDKETLLDNIKIKKQELNILKIVSYYKEKESKNSHLVVPNYLKLPQAMEKKV